MALNTTGEQCDGLQSVITLHNAIFDGDLEVTFEEQGMLHFPVVFKATYPADDPDIRPWTVMHRIG